MYQYRKLTEPQRIEVMHARERRGYPLHAPPHSSGTTTYMVSAACYEHACFIEPQERREHFADALLEALAGEVHAWIVLPNHYHALWTGDLGPLRERIRRLHNGTSTRWNREDAVRARQVWYHFADRRIRSESHYYASVNYIHANAAKHGWVGRADAWKTSSLWQWTEELGRDHLVTLWRKYPVRAYGKGWDD